MRVVHDANVIALRDEIDRTTLAMSFPCPGGVFVQVRESPAGTFYVGVAREHVGTWQTLGWSDSLAACDLYAEGVRSGLMAANAA